MTGEAVLVTGASGFVGRHALAPLAARGYEVHAVARRALHGAPAARWHEADLLDADARRRLVEAIRPAKLLHLAWCAEPGKFWEAPANLDWLAASIDLLRRFAEAGGRRVVAVGTCAEYDWSRSDDRPWREDDPCVPGTLYGKSKLALSNLLRDFALHAGLGQAWARLFLLYGPHEHAARLVPSLCRALVEGRPALVGPGTQIVDVLDVRDAGAALAALLDSAVTGAVNLASGRPVRIADLALTLGRLAGRSDLVALGALPARPGDPPSMAADIGRLATEIGFDPTRTLEEGLRDALDWWRSGASREN